MLNNPLVSVVVTLYNYEKYIKDCLLSIKKQDYDNIEIIVVDDCSKDESVNVANSVDDVKVIALTENKGYSFCKNVGIKSSKGEVIVLLDADDTVGFLLLLAILILLAITIFHTRPNLTIKKKELKK